MSQNAPPTGGDDDSTTELLLEMRDMVVPMLSIPGPTQGPPAAVPHGPPAERAKPVNRSMLLSDPLRWLQTESLDSCDPPSAAEVIPATLMSFGGLKSQQVAAEASPLVVSGSVAHSEGISGPPNPFSLRPMRRPVKRPRAEVPAGCAPTPRGRRLSVPCDVSELDRVFVAELSVSRIPEERWLLVSAALHLAGELLSRIDPPRSPPD